MKTRLKYILTGVLITLTLSSCDNWLNVTSSSQIRAEDQFESEAGFKDALMGVYIGMTAPESYGKDMSWYMVDILSQQYASFEPTAPYYEAQNFQFETTYTAERIDAMWSQSYNLIARINNILKYIEENKEVLDSVDYNIIKGELLGLRAFLHFDLLRLFGKGNLDDRPELLKELTIPYVTEYSKDIPPQQSYEQIFVLLNQDIEDGLKLLQSDPIYNTAERPEGYQDALQEDDFYEKRKVRMNYYALKALQARVLMWQGGMENMNQARLAAEKVIKNAPVHLIDSDTYSVSSDPILHPEILFSLNISGLEDITNPLLRAVDQEDYNAVYLTTGMVDDIYETGNVNIGPPDIRYNTLLDAQPLGYVSVKLLQENVSYSNTLPLVKLPEMYYIAAEYYMHNNELGKAIDYLNMVRASRGIIEDIPDTADRSAVEAEIFKEYRKEYVSEGQLFFFYKRLGLGTFPGLPSDITGDDDIYVLPYPDSENIFR